jgi:hypothetical protein
VRTSVAAAEEAALAVGGAGVDELAGEGAGSLLQAITATAAREKQRRGLRIMRLRGTSSVPSVDAAQFR